MYVCVLVYMLDLLTYLFRPSMAGSRIEHSPVVVAGIFFITIEVIFALLSVEVVILLVLVELVHHAKEHRKMRKLD